MCFVVFNLDQCFVFALVRFLILDPSLLTVSYSEAAVNLAGVTAIVGNIRLHTSHNRGKLYSLENIRLHTSHNRGNFTAYRVLDSTLPTTEGTL
jgi:hypothetical protein